MKQVISSTISIDKLNHEGRGIGSINGKTTFVSGALPGEEVNCQMIRKRSKLNEAKTIEVIKPSPDRIKAICAAYGTCGGCSLQHLDATKQIQHKQSVLKELLEHFGKVSPVSWQTPITGSTTGYRRKARLGVRYVRKKESVLVGFREQDGRFLTDMQACEVLDTRAGKTIHLWRAMLDTLEGKRDIPQIEVAASDSEIAFIIRHLVELSANDISIIKDFAKKHDFLIYLQPKGPKSLHLLYPEKEQHQLSYKIKEHNIEINFSPLDFTQVNAEINLKMINKAIELLDIKPDDTVLDLFCGLGNFSLPMARYAKQVIGFEGDTSMTTSASLNAKHNQLDNVKFYCADLFTSDIDAIKKVATYDKVLLDPPRAGAEAMMHVLPKLGAKKIVYVSCNAATLARDAGILVSQYGFKLKTAGVMDMFPHTAHVESIALFEA